MEFEPVSLLRRLFHCSKLLPHVAWCSCFLPDRAARHHSMSTQGTMKIALDVMGGDHGPAPAIEGALQAAQELDVEVHAGR